MYKIHSFKAKACINNKLGTFKFPFHGLVVTNKEQSARIDDLIIEKIEHDPELEDCDVDVLVEKKSIICTTDDFVDPALIGDGVYLH